MLEFEIAFSKEETSVALIGAIDEAMKAVGASLLTQIPKDSPPVAIDCSKVEQINSIGIFNWMTFVQNLANKTVFKFVGCPPAFVDACNLIPDFLSGGQVESLYIPAECSKGHESSFLRPTRLGTDESEHEKKIRLLKPGPCERCQEDAEPIVDDEFLLFLS